MSRGRYGTDAWGLIFERTREGFGEKHPPDPFLDICIHGVKEARIIDGFRKSPNCAQCFPPEEHDRRSRKFDGFTMVFDTSRDEDRKD
jgi:hypothetical protein